MRITEQEYLEALKNTQEAYTYFERERILKLLDEALEWAIGNPGDEPWSPTQTIKFAKQLINKEIETVILQEED